MINSNKVRLALNDIKKYYVIVFITYLMLSRIVLFVNVITLPVNSLIYNLLAIFGAAILAVDFFVNFTMFKSRENRFLLVFMVVCLISSVLNYSYGISSNLKTLVWTAIQFYILFSYVHIKGKEEISNMMCIIMKISSAIWFGAVGISLLQFVLQIRYRSPFAEFSRRQGFVDSRLFGVFSDPNFAAVTSLLVVIFCYFLQKKSTKKVVKIYYRTNIIFQMLYVILSGSRTSMIEGVLLSFIFTYLLERNKGYCLERKKAKMLALTKGLSVMLISIICVTVLPAPLLKVAQVGSHMKAYVLHHDANDDKEMDITLEREDVNEDNISNNRGEIWKSALEISSDKRLLGVSPRNMISYAKANYSNSYIAKTGYEAHNGYLAVLVGTGVIGFGVMIIFALSVMHRVIVYLKRKKHELYEDEIIMAFCSIVVIAISAFMLLDIFFVNTYSAGIFWLYLGYFVYLLKDKEADYEKN